MMRIAFFLVVLHCTLTSPAQAGVGPLGTPTPSRTFHEFKGALERDDLEALCQITDGEAYATYCGEFGLRALQSTLGAMDLAIQSIGRGVPSASRGRRHRLVAVDVIDQAHPERGVAVILLNHCWRSGRSGRRCRITDVQWPSPAQRLGRPYGEGFVD